MPQYIAYESDDRTVVETLCSGVTPEQLAEILHLAPGAWREITQDEARDLQKPTPEEALQALMQEYDALLEGMLDAFAAEKGYRDMRTLAGYTGKGNPEQFRQEAIYAVALRGEFWIAVNAIRAAVLSGERTVPTRDELLAELPPLVWPGNESAQEETDLEEIDDDPEALEKIRDGAGISIGQGREQV